MSVQGTGMGCPGATIVFEELIQLGVTRLLRVGTCGGLQADHALGDLIVAISAVPADATATHLVGGEPHCPTASWELVHEAVHVAKHAGQKIRVGPIVSSDLFYNPDEGQYERWSKRGVLAVEMEAAALFTLAALRGVHGGLPADRQRHRRRGRVRPDLRRRAPRRSRADDADRARHRNGGPRRPLAPGATVFLVNPASAGGSTGKRWPEIAHRAAARGLEGDALISDGPGQLGELAARAVSDGATRLVDRGRGRLRERGRERRRSGSTGVELAVIPRGTGWDFVRTFDIPARPRRRDRRRPARATCARSTRARSRTARGPATTREAHFANVGSAGISGAIAQAGERVVEGARRQALVLLGHARGVRRLADRRDARHRRRRDARAAG